MLTIRRASTQFQVIPNFDLNLKITLTYNFQSQAKVAFRWKYFIIIFEAKLLLAIIILNLKIQCFPKERKRQWSVTQLLRFEANTKDYIKVLKPLAISSSGLRLQQPVQKVTVFRGKLLEQPWQYLLFKPMSTITVLSTCWCILRLFIAEH